MRALSAHQRFAKSRSRWILPAFPEHTTSVLWGLGQHPNKQKTLISTEEEMSVFPIWRAICIACYFCSRFVIPHIYCVYKFIGVRSFLFKSTKGDESDAVINLFLTSTIFRWGGMRMK